MDRSSADRRPPGPVALDAPRPKRSPFAAVYRFVRGMFRPSEWQGYGAVRLTENQRWADGRTAAFVDEAAVLRLLSYLKSEHIKASAGKIQLVHLAEIRETVGEYWRRYADRALDLAQIVLRERLTSRDVYTRHGDDAFIVIFRDLDEPEAEAAAAAITKEICDRLFNDPSLGRDVSARSVTAGIAKLMRRDCGADLATLDRALERVSKRKADAMQQAEAAQAEALPRYDIRYTCDYRPMLFVPNWTVGIFVGVPGRELPNGRFIRGEAAYPPGEPGEITVAMDEACFERIIGDLKISVAGGSSALIGAMIHIHTLRTSKRVAKLLAELDPLEREYLVVEIVGVQEGTPTSALVEAAGHLRNRVKAINLRTGLRETDFERYQSVAIHSIGCDLRRRDLAPLSESQRNDAVRHYVERASVHNLQTHFYGVSTPAVLRTVLAAGAGYLIGDAVAGLVGRPTKPYRYGHENFVDKAR